MKNILFLFETLASLSACFFFWGAVALVSVKRKTWIRFLFGFLLALVVLYSIKNAEIPSGKNLEQLEVVG